MTGLASDFRVLRQLLLHRTEGDTHQERLESFYAGQAGDYDSFRSRLLHGRAEMISALNLPASGVWVDLGCGTGENVTFAGQRAADLSAIHLVDLSTSLLDVARRRVRDSGTDNVVLHTTDATRFDLQDESVDMVTFSYSLTMIPDWFAAIENAWRMLRPGGQIGVVDFFVSRKYAAPPRAQHGWAKRAFWQHWFATDNVFLNADHLAMLTRRFETLDLVESAGKVPYLPLLKAPFYRFVGRK